MKRTYVVLLFFTIFVNLAQSSEYKPLTDERRFGIGLNVLGPTGLASLSANYFVTPNIKVETGAGLIGYFGGGTYHFGGSMIGKATPYTGVYFSRLWDLWDNKTDGFLYLPIGVGGCRKNGFTFHVELAFFRNIKESYNLLWGGLKFGYYPKKRP